MSNKTELQNINTRLDSLIETLQGKAAGGGSVETCTVNINHTSVTVNTVTYTCLVDGQSEIRTEPIYGKVNFTLNDVVCGTAIVLWNNNGSNFYQWQFVGDITQITNNFDGEYAIDVLCCKTPGTVTATLEIDSSGSGPY